MSRCVDKPRGRKWSAGKRALKWGLALIGALVVLVVIAIAVVLFTDFGREQLRAMALEKVNSLIPGTVTIEEISKLDHKGIAARGVSVQDPLKSEVLSLETLNITYDLKSFIGGEIPVDEVFLSGLRVDLRPPEGPHRGLIAALVPTTGEKSGESTSPVDLTVEKLRLENGEVLFEVPTLGVVTLKEIEAEASARVGENIQAELASLTGALFRGDEKEPVATLESVRAAYFDDGNPSTVSVKGRFAGAAIEVTAKAVAPPALTWRKEPLELRVSANHVSKNLLLSIGQGDAAKKLKGIVDLTLNVDGTVDDLRGHLFVSTPGGKVKSLITAESLERFGLVATSSGINASRVYADLPDANIAFELEADVDVADGTEEIPFNVTLNKSRFDGEPLPHVKAKGTLTKDRIRGAEVEARGYGAHLLARGNLGFDGTGRFKADINVPDLGKLPKAAGFLSREDQPPGTLNLTVDAKVSAKKIDARGKIIASFVRHRAGSVETFDTDFDAKGALPFPTVSLDGRIEKLRTSGIKVAESTLVVKGGPDDYHLSLDAATDKGPVRLDAEVHRGEKRVLVDARGRGKFEEIPWSVEVNRADVGFAGDLSFPAVRVVASSQIVTISGSLTKKQAIDATLHAEEVDLAVVSKLLDTPHDFGGLVGLHLVAGGTLKSPDATITLDGRVQLPKGGGEIGVDATASYKDGAAALTMNVEDGKGELAVVDASVESEASRLNDFIKRAPKLPHQAGWHISLDVAKRRIQEIPMLTTLVELPEAIHGLSTDLDLNLSHAPGEEPAGYVAATVASSPGMVPLECGGDFGRVDARVELSSGRAGVSLLGTLGKEKWLTTWVDADLALREVLAGRGKPRLSNTEIRTDVKDLDLSSVPVACAFARGTVRLNVVGQGILGAQPVAAADLSARGLAMSGRESVDISARVEVSRKEAFVTGTLKHEENVSDFKASVPIRFEGTEFEVERKKPVRGEVHLVGLPIAPLLPRDAPISRVKGRVSGDVEVAGTLDEPQMDGELAIEGGALTANEFAQPLKGIAGRVTFTNDYIGIEDLVARDRDGRLSVDGRVDLAGGLPEKAHVVATLKEFPLRQQGQVAAEVNLKATLDAEFQEKETRAKLLLSDVDIWLEGGKQRGGISLKSHPDIIDPRVANAKADGPAKEPGRIHLVMNANDAFWVKRDDFAIKLATELVIDIGGGAVRVNGPVTIDRGFLYMLGENFELDRKSRIEFVESSPPDPVLDLSATVTAKRTSKVVKVVIRGRASKPELTFFVEDKEATAGDAVMAIFGNDGERSTDEDPTGQARSFVAGVMASLMAVAARKELGAAAPIIMIESGDEVRSAKLRAGFEIDSLIPKFMKGVVRGVYVEGIVGGSEDGSGTQGGVLLELYFPFGLVGSGQYGPGETWSIDASWEP